MKRTLLDITQKISRSPKKIQLVSKNLNDSNHSIWEAKGWKFNDILREIQYRETQDRVKILINTQSISAKDYIIEMGSNGLIVKFIKSHFEYELDEFDYVEMVGDIEKYA